MVLALLVGLVSGVALAEDVAVSFLGHSCFTIQEEGGPVILIDPYGSYVPYPGLPVPADIVLMTHAHIVHCPYCFGENDRVSGGPDHRPPLGRERPMSREASADSVGDHT